MLIPKNSLAIIYSDIWGGFHKRLETSADSGAVREEVLSTAGETGCPQCLRKRE